MSLKYEPSSAPQVKTRKIETLEEELRDLGLQEKARYPPPVREPLARRGRGRFGGPSSRNQVRPTLLLLYSLHRS